MTCILSEEAGFGLLAWAVTLTPLVMVAVGIAYVAIRRRRLSDADCEPYGDVPRQP